LLLLRDTDICEKRVVSHSPGSIPIRREGPGKEQYTV
jgi:hypothetical protein